VENIVEGVSFTANSIQIGGEPGVPAAFVASVVSAADARALAHAVGWQRTRQFLAPAAETADEVLALRELVTVVDALELVAAAGGGPLHLSQPQVLLLTTAATLYAAEGDTEDYIPPAERERLERLRTLSDRLMGVAADLAAALEQPHPTRH